MKILLDTSTLVAAMVAGHPAHNVTLPLLLRVKEKADTGLVAAHSLAELYAILTRLPVAPRISPILARQLIQRDVIDICQVITLSADDYVAVLNHMANLKIAGGVVYDALILHAAWIADVDQVVTLNPRDFRRAYPQSAGKIVSPLEQ